MKSILTLFIVCLVGMSVVAQNTSGNHLITHLNIRTTNKTIEVKAPDGEDLIKSVERSSVNIGSFSPSFGIYHESGSLSEIELTQFSIGSEDGIYLLEGANHEIAGKTNTFGLGVRYEYDYPLISNGSMTLYGGAFTGFNYYKESIKPESEYLYKTSNSLFELPIGILPKVIYRFGESFFMTYSVPITLLSIHSTKEKYESDIVPSGGTDISDSGTTFLPGNVLVRVGIGVSF